MQMKKYDSSDKVKYVAFRFIILGDPPNMNIPTITAFVDLTLAIVLYYDGVANAAHPCDNIYHDCSTTTNKNNLVANCSYKQQKICIPRELSNDITVLDLSGNTMVDITYGSFDKYNQLKVLIMKDMTKGSPFSKAPYIFRNMYTLEVIDFTRSFVDDDIIDFAWPPNIRVIHCSENRNYKNLEIDHLRKLEKLYASGITRLEKFPTFHELAGIILIDIKNTPVDVTTDIISNYCYLEHFTFTPNTNLTYCECEKIKLWMSHYRIKSGSPIVCKSENFSDPTCDVAFTTKEIEQRRHCFGRSMWLRTSSRWWITLPVVLIVLLSFLIPSYIYVKKYRDVKHKLHHPKTQRSYNITPNPPIEEEGANEDESSIEG